MNKELFHRVRYFAAVISGTYIAAGVPAFMLAMLAKAVFPLSEEQSLLWIGVPFAILIAVFAWPRMPKIMGFDDEK